jgi:hypothetical protein
MALMSLHIISSANRYDAIDREQFRAMIESESFKVLQARIAAERDRHITTCTNSDIQLDVMRAQGGAAAIETAMGLPRRILEEMSAPRK